MVHNVLDFLLFWLVVMDLKPGDVEENGVKELRNEFMVINYNEKPEF